MRVRCFWRAAIAVLGALALTEPAQAEMTPALEARLAGTPAAERVPVLVTLAHQVAAEDYAGRPGELVRALRAAAAHTQPGPDGGLNSARSPVLARQRPGPRGHADPGATPSPRPHDRRAAVTLSAGQLRINQRISQAAVHRASVLEARIAGRRPPAAPTAKPGARITLSAGQLRINQRISQAAIRRVAALGG